MFARKSGDTAEIGGLLIIFAIAFLISILFLFDGLKVTFNFFLTFLFVIFLLLFLLLTKEVLHVVKGKSKEAQAAPATDGEEQLGGLLHRAGAQVEAVDGEEDVAGGDQRPLVGVGVALEATGRSGGPGGGPFLADTGHDEWTVALWAADDVHAQALALLQSERDVAQRQAQAEVVEGGGRGGRTALGQEGAQVQSDLLLIGERVLVLVLVTLFVPFLVLVLVLVLVLFLLFLSFRPLLGVHIGQLVDSLDAVEGDLAAHFVPHLSQRLLAGLAHLPHLPGAVVHHLHLLDATVALQLQVVDGQLQAGDDALVLGLRFDLGLTGRRHHLLHLFAGDLLEGLQVSGVQFAAGVVFGTGIALLLEAVLQVPLGGGAQGEQLTLQLGDLLLEGGDAFRREDAVVQYLAEAVGQHGQLGVGLLRNDVRK
ncbi:hypothetical protein TYRP_004187 [Tyrophagus putrescentiae]|nr:hypothetical protein TYRP_004187 [Tyrophagus putrescentiae]